MLFNHVAHSALRCLRVQGETADGAEVKVEEPIPQDTNIGVEFEPCKKMVGCERMCPVGKKHRGMCKVNGKMVKPDKMQTDIDDEPKAGALGGDHVLGADRVLRERKHPMEKFLEDAESSLNTPEPKKKRVKEETDTDETTKKQLAALKKELASLKKQLARR